MSDLWSFCALPWALLESSAIAIKLITETTLEILEILASPTTDAPPSPAPLHVAGGGGVLVFGTILSKFVGENAIKTGSPES